MVEEKLTSRLIKATALISDARLLLSAWDPEQSVASNIERARAENILGKPSRMRSEDILRVFRRRYFADPEVGRALVGLARANVPAHWLNPLLYYYAAMGDSTLRAIIIEVLYPRRMAGHREVAVEDVLVALREWVAEGRTSSRWERNTMLRVARHSLAALRDYGLLAGKTRKSIGTIRLPIETFAFIGFDLMKREGSGERTLLSEMWKIFFLSTTAVERIMIEAHQERLLSYHAAGSVVRLEFPVKTLPEYANVLIARARSQA